MQAPKLNYSARVAVINSFDVPRLELGGMFNGIVENDNGYVSVRPSERCAHKCVFKEGEIQT